MGTLTDEDTTPRVDLSGLNETGEAIDARLAVILIARGELGEQDPDKYWHVVQPGLVGHRHDVSWCGGFALWCLRQARLCDWDWVIGKGFLFHLPATHEPKAGDIAYFGNLSHHAIVELVQDGKLHSIDGNTMPYPKEGVTAKTRDLSQVTVFYSIAHLVGETP